SRIHRLPADGADLDAAARAATAVLTQVLGTPPRLDAALLGVGPDGHVCSLFPGHPLLAEHRRWVAPVTDSPKPPSRRLTMTLPALWAAGIVIIVATGEAKAEVIREAVDNRGSQLPLALVARGARRVAFVLDHGAAQALAR